MSARSLRQRQRRHEARKREDIAQTAAERASGQTPHLDLKCCICADDAAEREPMAVWGWLRERWGR